jgi:uncharacterized protein YPO0396
LLAEAVRTQESESGLRARRAEAIDGVSGLNVRRGILAKLEETRDWSDLDWQAVVNKIAALNAERRQIESKSKALQQLAQQLATISEKIDACDGEHMQLLGDNGADDGAVRRAEDELVRSQATLAESGLDAAQQYFEAIEVRFAAHPAVAEADAPADIVSVEGKVRDELTVPVDARQTEQSRLGQRIVRRMGEFRARYPLETLDVDDSVLAVNDYRQLCDRLEGDDLPRFESAFKEYLNTNTIRDIAGFHSQLNKQGEIIRDRVEVINESLVGIDYNPGRYIRLEAQRTPNTEIKDFISELRACTDSALSGEEPDQYSEQKFLQVKAIVERFKGREGQTEHDHAWSRRVTDVRNWFVFSASERSREDDTEYEHYSDSAGKSGGQKEKLAYTILAASLAYQFKLGWGVVRSKTFRFVVIDEAFGRGSDESTRFALSLFQRLGLQLLIVTPLQKIHVIEPFVSAVGFVDNRTGDSSRLQTMSIEEYRERQAAHVGAGRVDILAAGQ